MPFLQEIFSNFGMDAKDIALILKTIFFGMLGGFLSNAATEYIKDNETDFSITGWKSNLKFSFIGGICATIAQMVDGSEKVLILQALTIGATWPRIVHRFRKQAAFDKFVASNQDVPVEKK